MPRLPIKNRHQYELGIIGNCAYLSLINKDAAVQWLCWPKFDSSFIFGSLLDAGGSGEFSILPAESDYATSQYYIENTNVLCTEFETGGGEKYKVTDFAPRFEQNYRYYRPLMLIRKIEPMSDMPVIRIKCEPVGNYGKLKPTTAMGSNHIMYLGFEQQVRLTTNVSLNYIMEHESFVLNEPKYLVLTYGIPLETSLEYTAEDFLKKTIKYWHDWVTTTSIGTFYQQQIIRSALVLKIHQYEDTGAIIAAATTSLPEFPQSTRNWDYRYCWMRDTYYTLTAFNNIGHFEEMKKYFNYIENVTRHENDRFQPLYRVDTKKEIKEIILDYLPGYLDNQPVRVGNDAYTHIQNDVYGQVLVSLLPFYTDKRFISRDRVYSLRLVEHALQKIKDTMDEKDAGLWEFRNTAQVHCYTLLFHWAGSSAAYKIASAFKDRVLMEKAMKLRDVAAKKIHSCKIPGTDAYAQAIGSKHLDASCLHLITMRYLGPNSEEAHQHLKEIEKTLKAEGGLFYRYKHADDFGKPETTFLICAYWYVEALACVGRIDEAVEYFENLSKYSNYLGLLSEDVDAQTGSQWGNFPQAYSHVGQVNAAYRIAKKLDYPNFY